MVAAIAAPIVAALGGSTLASIGVNLALYAGVSAASILLQQSMVPRQEQEIGTKLSAVLGGAVNQSFHFGRKETAGSFIYKNTWGINGRVPNAFLVRIYCLSDRRVEGFEDYVWAAGRKCNYDPGVTDTVDGVNLGHPINAFNSGGGHRLWVKFHDGSQTSADNYLVDKFGSDPQRPWTEDHIGRGRAYMIVTQKYDKKLPTGEIDVLPVIKNGRWYDWRNDSTNGGSGSERYGTYSTYSVDPGNPVKAIYNIMRGVYEGNEWLFGGHSWPARRFDNDTWTAAANKCDEDVAIAGGGTQKRFRIGAEIDASEEPWTVIARCLKACNGRLVESGGVFKIYVGGIGASVYSFTDDDVLVSEDLTAKLFPGRDQIANTITGTYVEPANAGEAKAYKSRFKQDYVDEDGEERKTTLDFEYVRDNRQAQWVVSLALNDNRRLRTFVDGFWTHARALEPCDVVSWTSARFGFTNKKFIVGDVPLRDDGVVILNLREADAADSDWSTSDEDEFETGVFEDFEAPTQTISLTASAVAVTDDDNTTNRRPAIRLQASLDDEFVDCRALLYQVRKKNGDQKILLPDGRSDGFFDPDSDNYGDISFTDNSFLPNRQVQVRGKIDPESDRDTSWGSWIDVSLGDYGFDDDDTTNATLAAPAKPVLAKVQDDDEDGKVSTDVYMTTVPPAWATSKTRYEWEITVDANDPIIKRSGGSNYEYKVRKTGVAIVVRVRGVKGVGKESAWSDPETITPTKKGNSVPTPANVSASAKAKGNRIKGDDPNMKDLKWALFYRNTANNTGTATLAEKRKGLSWRDDDPPGNLGDTAYYWMRFVDNSDNIGSFSSVATCVNKGVEDADLDSTAPSTPGIPSLTTSSADVDKDGTQETFLTAAWTQGGSVTVKTHTLEVTRSPTVGGTYVGWKEFEVDGSKLSKRFPANANFFYKARATAKGGAKLGASTPSNYTTTGVQPVARTFNLDVSSLSVTWESYRRKHVVKVNNLPMDDPEFAYVEISQRVGASTWTVVDRGRKAKFEFINPPSGVQKYRAKLYTFTKAASADFDSPGTSYSNSGTGADGVDDIITQDLSAACVTAAKLSGASDPGGAAVTADKLAHNITEAQEAYNAGSQTAGVVQSLTVNHGAADHIMVWGSCVNTSGSVKVEFDVSLETGGGSTFSSKTMSTENDGDIEIFGVLGGLSGSSTTIQMRVVGSWNKAFRRIIAVPIW